MNYYIKTLIIKCFKSLAIIVLWHLSNPVFLHAQSTPSSLPPTDSITSQASSSVDLSQSKSDRSSQSKTTSPTLVERPALVKRPTLIKRLMRAPAISSFKKKKKTASFMSALEQNWHQDLNFISGRLRMPQDPGASYHDLKGGLLHTRWKHRSGWGVDFGYLFVRETLYLAFKPTFNASESRITPTNDQSGVYTYTNPDSPNNANESMGQKEIGWHHALSSGIRYIHLNRKNRYALTVAAGISYRWIPKDRMLTFNRPNSSQSSSAMNTTIDQDTTESTTRTVRLSHSLPQESNLQAWGSIHWQHHWYWCKAQWGGLQSDVSAWALFSSFAGINLGRAQLGVGWAWGQVSHGSLFLLQLPLSAAIHLRASVWIRQPPYDDSLITVGFRWTGEQESPELDPPTRKPINQRQKSQQLTPFDPVPLNPVQPGQQPTDRPLSPLNTPTPL